MSKSTTNDDVIILINMNIEYIITTSLLKVCKCLRGLRNKVVKRRDHFFHGYTHGTRRCFKKDGNWIYERTVKLPNNEAIYKDIPEKVIDLYEVKSLFKKNFLQKYWNGLDKLINNVIFNLMEEGILSVVPLEQVKDGKFNSKFIQQADVDTQKINELRFFKVSIR
ncbi:hypothetical protein GF362_07655 [Candidatus Dojkabacteria bacterium]|nr:hypothetical protein [Candidatus Dojkabacteria bacterium]